MMENRFNFEEDQAEDIVEEESEKNKEENEFFDSDKKFENLEFASESDKRAPEDDLKLTESEKLVESELRDMLFHCDITNFFNVIQSIKNGEKYFKSEYLRNRAGFAISKMLDEDKMEGLQLLIDRFDFNQEEFNRIAKEVIVNRLKSRKTIWHIEENIDIEKVIDPLELQVLKEKSFCDFLKYENIKNAREFIAGSNLSEEKIREISKSVFFTELEEGNSKALIIGEEFGFLDNLSDDIKASASKGFLKDIREDSIYSAMDIKEQIPIKESILHSKEVKTAAENSLLECLYDHDVKNSLRISSSFDLSEDFLSSDKLRSGVEYILFYCIKNNIDVLSFAKVFNTPKEDIESVIGDAINGYLDDGHVFLASELVKKYDFPKEETEKIVRYQILHNLFKDDFPLIEIKETFNISKDFFLSPDIKPLITEYVIKEIGRGYKEILDNFEFSDAEIGNMAERAFINCCLDGESDEAFERARDIKRDFMSDEDFSHPGVKESAEGLFSRIYWHFLTSTEDEDYSIKGNLEYLSAIGKELKIDQEYIEADSWRKLLSCIDEGNIQYASEIKDSFLRNITGKDIIERIGSRENFFEVLKEKKENLYNKAEKSVDFLLQILKYENIDDFIQYADNISFLENVIDGNERFGYRLFLSFEQFDELSKKNIISLLTWKEEILKENPDIDPNTSQFRIKMQEKMSKYGNNKDTLKKLSKLIDSDKWLNYDEEDKFILKEEEDLDMSEVVSVPLSRLDTTIFNYIDIAKENIGGYEEKLKEAMIYSEQYYKTEALVNKIKKSLEVEKDENRKIGMQKGLETQIINLNKLKDSQTSIWDKIATIIDSVKDKQTRVRELNKSLIAIEKELDSSYSEETKNKLSKNKEDLKRAFYEVRDSVHMLKSAISKDLSVVLGRDAASEIMETIEKQSSEELEHLTLDLEQLGAVFSEKKEERNFIGNQMLIKVWDRNPDVDFYQGNYSPCCISIESGCGSSYEESAISDYLTDYSIQVVNIVDNKRKIPIVAAWSWIGKNENNEVFYVIDNIEANTDYTSKYPNSLSKRLTNYIKNYAKSIGIDEKHIQKGPYNNDLMLDFDSVSSDIIKIGKPNREDGYYLESEMIGEENGEDDEDDEDE